MTEQASRYGEDHIRRSASVFLAGKLISAVGGIVTVILLARYLTIGEFAAYSALTGFVDLFTALVGFGITHALLRFLPELYAQHQDRTIKRLLGLGILTRTLTLTTAVILVSYGSGPVTEFFKLSDWQTAFSLFLWLVWIRVTFYFLFQLLETLLAQAIGQAGFVFANISKLIGVIVASGGEQLDLVVVIQIEIAAELVGVIILALGLIRTIINQSNQDASGPGWLEKNWKRIWRFGVVAYLQHLAVLLYGSSPNRLVGARYLPAGEMASLGFAQSLIDNMRRYLPAQFFQGIIHPVLIARYATGRNFAEIARIADILLRFNTLVLGLPLIVLMVSGDDLLSFLSKGKYSDEASLALILFSIALAFESDRYLLDILVQAVERYDMLLYTNLILSGSLLLALLFIPKFGIAAIPLANFAGLVVANGVVRIWLKNKGFDCLVNWLSYLKIILAGLLSVTAGHFVSEWLIQFDLEAFIWIIAAVITLGTYLLLVWFFKPFSSDELSGLSRLRKSKGS